MTLKESGMQIDKELQKQCNKWISDIREIDDKLVQLESVIKTAAAFGDLSENNEYQSAVDMRQQYIKDKADLEFKVSMHKSKFATYATGEKSRGEMVAVGSVVSVLYEDIGKRYVVKVVPAKSDSPQKGAIPDTSPLGRALLNKSQGDTITVVTERREWRCLIEEVY